MKIKEWNEFMDTVLYEAEFLGIKYEVKPDDLDFFYEFENEKTALMKFANEEEKQTYMNKFLNGELIAVGVVKYTKCQCCEEWVYSDSVWGYHVSDPEEALKLYLSR